MCCYYASLTVFLCYGCQQIYTLPTAQPRIEVSVRGSLKRAIAIAGPIRKREWIGEPLDFPRGWWPIKPTDWLNTQWDRPSVLWLGPEQGPPTVVLRAWRESGVYGFSGLFIFRLKKGRWLRDKAPAAPIEFSRDGSFYIEGSRIFVWDSVYEPRLESHNSPHKYKLRIYKDDGKQLSLERSVITKKKYAVGVFSDGSTTRGDSMPKQVDPLAELGYRWKWWGPHLKR